jgi:hypothetical protein
MMRSLLKKIAFVLIVCFLGFVVIRTQTVMDKNRAIRFVDRRPVFLPRGDVLKWASLGYRGLVADWLWIRSVLYYGRRTADGDNPYYRFAMKSGSIDEELRTVKTATSVPDSMTGIGAELRHLLYQQNNRGLVEYIYPMLDRVTTVDPHFIFPYLFGGVYVLMDTGEIASARLLLEKGYRANPDVWQFPFYLGWIHWMYLGDVEKTYAYLSEAIGKVGCPAFVAELFAGLSKNLGKNELARRYLEGLLESTENPEMRGRIEKILMGIEGGNK